MKFYSYENPPEKFELTGFYPLYSDEENARLDIEIDELILNTELFCPNKRTFIGINQNDLEILNSDNFENISSIPNQSHSIDLTIEKIASRQVNIKALILKHSKALE